MVCIFVSIGQHWFITSQDVYLKRGASGGLSLENSAVLTELCTTPPNSSFNPSSEISESFNYFSLGGRGGGRIHASDGNSSRRV